MPVRFAAGLWILKMTILLAWVWGAAVRNPVRAIDFGFGRPYRPPRSRVAFWPRFWFSSSPTAFPPPDPKPQIRAFARDPDHWGRDTVNCKEAGPMRLA